MDGRADNFFHALDGTVLDWGRVLGSGFKNAPKGWVSVFRECSLEEIVRIGREGLSPSPPEMRPPDFRQEMELLDAHRPAALVKQGVSRLNAIYAVPTPDTPKLPHRHEHIVIEVRVNPEECVVGDMDFITAIIPFIGAQRFGMDKYQGAFRKYWESVIPFADFLRHYRRTETFAGSQWFAKRSAPPRLPKMFFAPEIMVMTPTISREHIRIVRGHVTDIVDEDDHDHDHGEEFSYYDEG